MFLTAYALRVLARCVAHRRPGVSRLAIQLPLIGAVLLGLLYLLTRVSQVRSSQSLLDGPRTVDAAAESDWLGQLVPVLSIPAIIVFSLGLALVSLFAMRVGLLTRFLGILGIVIGIAFVITGAQISPLPQCVWLGGLAVMFAGRWPGGQPPAWATGRDEPCATQQELREARERGARKPEPAAAPAAAAAVAGRAHPSSKKRKRKRRG